MWNTDDTTIHAIIKRKSEVKNNMKNKGKKIESDIEKIKNFIVDLGFICNSCPSAQNLIYTKDGETVIIRNDK